MSLKDTLTKRAKATGQKTIQGTETPAEAVTKAKDTGQLAGMLKGAKKSEPNFGEIDITFDTGPVSKWSFSGLKSHETCAKYTKLNKVDKIPQESGEASKRGSLIHDGCELWVRGESAELPSDAKTKFEAFTEDFQQLRSDFNDGKVELEEKWGIRKDWSPCTWDDPEIWGRGALDAFVHEDGESCRIIDYKTGQKFGNEMKHADQGLCYALHAANRYPDLNIFQVEFWYLDQGEKTIRMFNRKQLQILHPRYHNRAKKMTTETRFTPSPNPHNCRFCAYGSNVNKKGAPYGNGACPDDAYRTMEE